ncbi:hypothetical protein [Microvirga rosea]|uniref:hypothetical protein n=1 Tax=Microvirga rosea TaxID=2715425 RepID=UPI001D0B26C5|nr:hypothetical protein [Microvirga rosea]MCB8823094.1 hypothetical protein [Microvirga rosea]
MKFLYSAAAVLVLGSFGHAEAAGTCEVDPLPLARKIDTESHMVVSSGSACGMNITLPGAINDIKIIQKPKSGIAGIRGSAVFYAPKPGFKGRDEFAYTYEGTEAYGGEINITIRQKVDVIP